GAKQLAIDVIAQAVDGQQVNFLNACGGLGGYTDLHILRVHQGAHIAPVAAGQGDDFHAPVMGGLDRLNHVGGVAAGGNRQQHVPVCPQGADLLGEDLVVTVVVGNRSDGGAVGGQGNGRQARTFPLEPVEEFRGEMLGVAR